MANRSYLYSLSNRPMAYADRPETISGLSEWPYAVPLSYRVLMSGDPRLCSSLISDGFEDDPPERRTRLHAISGEFDDDCDNTRDGRTSNPLGVSWWTDVLYFDLWNRAEFEANQ